MLIFVYGTFCKGLSRNSVLKDAKHLGIASCKGNLIDIGSYPALIQGDGKVIGEIYQIDPDVILQRLDEIEGYNEHNEIGSYYVRRKTAATLFSNGATVDAAIYFYNQKHAEHPSIECNDYRRYLLDKGKGPVYYLAYGSNLSTERLRGRIGKWGKTLSGCIPGYRLTFNKDDGESAVYANITAEKSGKDCLCVAYEVSRESLLILDKWEGVKDNHYIRTVLPFKSNSGEEMMGYVYIAAPEKLVSGRSPSDDYKKYLVTGYKEHKLGDLIL